MAFDDKISDEKLQYNINRKAAKIDKFLNSLGKIDKCEFLIGEEILPSFQRGTIEQSKFMYFSLETAFEKQTKTI